MGITIIADPSENMGLLVGNLLEGWHDVKFVIPDGFWSWTIDRVLDRRSMLNCCEFVIDYTLKHSYPRILNIFYLFYLNL